MDGLRPSADYNPGVRSVAASVGILITLLATASVGAAPVPVGERVLRHGVLRQTGVVWGHTALVRALAFSPVDRTLVSGGSDASLRYWSLRTRKETRYVPFPAGG